MPKSHQMSGLVNVSVYAHHLSNHQKTDPNITKSLISKCQISKSLITAVAAASLLWLLCCVEKKVTDRLTELLKDADRSGAADPDRGFVRRDQDRPELHQLHLCHHQVHQLSHKEPQKHNNSEVITAWQVT